MRFPRICRTALAVTALSTALRAQTADFNEVGRQMAITLQNSHFARLPYSAETSQRFLQEYLDGLDPGRIYFLQGDIDRFKKDLGDVLYARLMKGDSLKDATLIFRTYQQRVETQSANIKELLEKEPFDFTKKETVEISRKDASWPRDAADAKNLLRLQIKDALLGEALRREAEAKAAKEKGKPEPKEERDAKEIVSLRYERFVQGVKDTDDEEIANTFFSAVTRAYDPHTEYMSFREATRFNDSMRNEMVGIGAELQPQKDGSTQVMGLVIGGPADREGSLKLNDRIVGVDTENTGELTDVLFMDRMKVVELVRGKEGSAVRLKVLSADDAEARFVTITRGKIEMKSAQASAGVIEMALPDNGKHRLGWIGLPSFYSDFKSGKTRCSVDVEKLLQRLNTEKIDGLVLDLRDNGGGSLEEVRRMTGFFTGRGPVVQEKNTLGQITAQSSDNLKPIYTGPMVVLVNKRSASASEILAGALQDYNRAVIVGDSSTFGKGTVQEPMDLGRMMPFFSNRERAGALKLTIRKFYRPSGSSTQLEGVASDIPLPGLADGLEFGEQYLPHAFPHDRIRPSSGLNPLNREDLFVPRLHELSQERRRADKDFAYLTDDLTRATTRLKENKVSLNIDDRRKEMTEADARKRERNAERTARFKQMADIDAKVFTFYKLTLDDLNQGNGLRAYDPTKDDDDFVHHAKKTEDADATPAWPSGLDPVKREGLNVLNDLISTTESARVAGILKPPSNIR